MSLLAQSIGQIFEIEFCHILLFWAFFTLKSDPNYLQFKFHNLILYWAYDRGPKSFKLLGSYIRVTYSKCVQGAMGPKLISVMHGITVMVYQWCQNPISVMHGIAVMVYQKFFICNSLAIMFKWQVKDVEMQNKATLRS